MGFMNVGVTGGLGFGSIMIVLIAWGLFWKGLALWHSARHHQAWWFVLILCLNTIGILEIVYLFTVLKLKPKDLFSKAGK